MGRIQYCDIANFVDFRSFCQDHSMRRGASTQYVVQWAQSTIWSFALRVIQSWGVSTDEEVSMLRASLIPFSLLPMRCFRFLVLCFEISFQHYNYTADLRNTNLFPISCSIASITHVGVGLYRSLSPKIGLLHPHSAEPPSSQLMEVNKNIATQVTVPVPVSSASQEEILSSVWRTSHIVHIGRQLTVPGLRIRTVIGPRFRLLNSPIP